MYPILRVLVFLPAAVLAAGLDLLLLSLDARVVGVPRVLVHALLWAPGIMVLVGAVLAWRGLAIRWALVPLSAVSVLLSVGITIENWPFFSEEPLAFAWAAGLLVAPILAWLLPSRAWVERAAA